MKIAYITDVRLNEPTAPAHHVRWRCGAIADMGHEVTLIHAGPRLPAAEAARFHRDVPLPWPRFRGGAYLFRRSLFQALHRAIQDAAEVVYMRTSLHPALTRKIAELPIPVVGEIHGLETCETPEFPRYVQALDLLLTPSEELRAICLTATGIAADRVAVQAGPGVDAVRFAPRDQAAARQELGWDRKRWIALFVSGYQAHHDFDTALNAMRILRDRNAEATLMMLGDGPNRAAVEEKARDLVEAGFVRFLDAAPSSALPAYIGAADACLSLTKRHFLADGNLRGFKVMEYTACASPSVVTIDASLPTPEWARQTLALIAPESADGLAATLLDMMEHGDRWRNRAAAARDYVERNLSWPAVAGTTVAHLERVAHMGARRSKRPEPVAR